MPKKPKKSKPARTTKQAPPSKKRGDNKASAAEAEHKLPPEVQLYFAVGDLATVASNWRLLRQAAIQNKNTFETQLRIAEAQARSQGESPGSPVPPPLPQPPTAPPEPQRVWDAGILACDKMLAAAREVARSRSSQVSDNRLIDVLSHVSPAEQLFMGLKEMPTTTLFAEARQLRALHRWARRTTNQLWAEAEIAIERNPRGPAKTRSRRVILVPPGSYKFKRPIPTGEAAVMAGTRSDYLLNKLVRAKCPLGGSTREPCAELEDIIPLVPKKASVVRAWADREYPPT